MAQSPDDERLSRFPLFREVEAAQLAATSRQVRWRRAQPGEVVIDFDDTSDDVFLIISGTVRVAVHSASGQEVILGELGAGDIFGEMSAIDGLSRSANVTAVNTSMLCCVPRPVFLDLVLRTPAAALMLLQLLTSRLRLLDARNVEMAVLPVRHRLVAELLRLSRPREDGVLRITPPPAQHVLASRIGARREAVSRELSALEREGLIDRPRNRQSILLPKPEALRQALRLAMAGDARKGEAGKAPAKGPHKAASRGPKAA